MVNTTKKGDHFELEVYEYFKEELEKENIPFVNPKFDWKIFHKKSYWSALREEEIIFDVTIEVYWNNNLSLLVFIECKNHKRNIEPGFVDKFLDNVNQISEFNTRAIFTSKSALSQSAYNTCKKRGVGFVRFYENQPQWELNRTFAHSYNSTSNQQVNLQSLLSQEEDNTFYQSLFFVNNRITISFNEFFIGLLSELYSDDFKLSNKAPTEIKVKYKSKPDIEEVANNILESVDYLKDAVDLEKVVDITDLAVTFVDKDSLADNILGAINFKKKAITVYKDENIYRQRFTLAHELGHYFLKHEKYFNSEKYSVEESKIFVENEDQIRLLEYQANYFASCLLMPRKQFIIDFLLILSLHNIENRGFGLLYVDNQRENLSNYHKVCEALKLKYRVSKAAITFKLKEYGLLVDNRLDESEFAFNSIFPN